MRIGPRGSGEAAVRLARLRKLVRAPARLGESAPASLEGIPRLEAAASASGEIPIQASAYPEARTSVEVQHLGRVSGDHRLLIGRDDPHGNGALGCADETVGGLVAILVELNSKPAASGGDAIP